MRYVGAGAAQGIGREVAQLLRAEGHAAGSLAADQTLLPRSAEVSP